MRAKRARELLEDILARSEIEVAAVKRRWHEPEWDYHDRVEAMRLEILALKVAIAAVSHAHAHDVRLDHPAYT